MENIFGLFEGKFKLFSHNKERRSTKIYEDVYFKQCNSELDDNN